MSDYPFVFVNHGTFDAESLDKAEELFVWFRGPVAPALRDEIFRDCPTPVAYVWHWDREFCYFGSPGDTYDSSVIADYAPPAIRDALAAAAASKDWAASMKVFERAQEHADASIAAFCSDLERWARRVHSLAPIAALWGPNGAGGDDPWHAWSVAHFADAMAPRLAAYAPDAPGRETFGWIKGMCRELLVAAAPRGAKARDRDAADTRAVTVLDEAAEKHRPKRYVSRLSYPEHDLLELGSQIAGHVGKGRGAAAKLARLAPLTQLVFLGSYAADVRALERAGLDVVAYARALVPRLTEAQRPSAVPLLTMLAQTLARDTPAFDKPRRREGARAAAVLRAGFDQPGVLAATYARASRYLRWAKRFDEARALADEGLARFGERRVLLRAAARAAERAGDATAAQGFRTRLDALPPRTPREAT